MTLDTYITDRRNRKAWLTCQQIAREPGQHPPVWLYGPSGVGKTHLLTALCHHPAWEGRTVCFVTAQEVGEALTDRLQGRTERWDALQQADLLVVDNLEYLQGKIATQTAVAQLWQEMVRQQRTVVVASICQPADLPGLWSGCAPVTVKVPRPGVVLRRRYARRYLEQHPCPIHRTTRMRLVWRTRTIPQLTGALNTEYARETAL